MLGMIAEPVVYLVVWQTVADSRGGSVEGITAGEFAAYYIVWTLVRNMNIVFTPYGWEERIRQGELSGMLVRPVHPLHHDLAYFAGWKVVVVVLWVPIAAVLALVFRPTFDVSLVEVLVFLVAIWGAYLIRSMLLWVLGMVTFWTTRVSALYELYFTAELLLSGRLLPLVLLPAWAGTAADSAAVPVHVRLPDRGARRGPEHGRAVGRAGRAGRLGARRHRAGGRRLAVRRPALLGGGQLMVGLMEGG